MAARRLFFALWPAPDVRAALEAAAAPVREHCSGSLVPVDNFHITLRFMGNVAEDRLEALLGAGDAATGRQFDLPLERVGFWDKPAVVWLGPRNPGDELLRLVANLNTELESAGFGPDPRPYRPHLTLLRKAERGPEQLYLDRRVTWPVANFSLIESETRPDGPVYTPLKTWPLNPPDAE